MNDYSKKSLVSLLIMIVAGLIILATVITLSDCSNSGGVTIWNIIDAIGSLCAIVLGFHFGTSNGVPVDPVYVTLTQSMAPSQSDALSVDAFSIEQGARMSLTLEVTYYNNHTTATTFYQPRWVLYGAESQGQSFTEILSSNLGDIANKVVSSSSSETAQYTYSSHTTLGMYTWFKVVFTTQSPELTANKEGDGTDVINVE